MDSKIETVLMDPQHPKLEEFQRKLKDSLLSRIAREEEKLAEATREREKQR